MHKFQISFIGLNNLYGQASSLLLKQSPFVKCIKLYDETNIAPALDVASLNTSCKVKAYLGKDQLKHALKESDIIIIGDQCLDNKFSSTAPKLCDYAKSIAQTSPEAIIVLAGEPVNSLLPLMTRIMVDLGCYDSNKVFGATTSDNVRANSLLAQHLNADPKNVVLPVIGGSSQTTRIPVFSQAKPNCSLTEETKADIINKVKEGDKNIQIYKGCSESLNKAYSLVKFINSIMSGLRGDANVTDIALTRTTLVPGVEYFSLPVVLGRHGIVKRYGIPELAREEKEMLKEAIVDLNRDAEKAKIYLKGSSMIVERTKQDFIVKNKREESNNFWQPLVKRNPKDSYTIDTPFYKTVNSSTLITCRPISCPVSDLIEPKKNSDKKHENNEKNESKTTDLKTDNQPKQADIKEETPKTETKPPLKAEETPNDTPKPIKSKSKQSKYNKPILKFGKVSDKKYIASKFKIQKTNQKEHKGMDKMNHSKKQIIQKMYTKKKFSLDKNVNGKIKLTPAEVKDFTTQLKKYIDLAEGKTVNETTVTSKISIAERKATNEKKINLSHDKIKKCSEKQEIKSNQGQGDEILKDVVPFKVSKRRHLKRSKKFQSKTIDSSKKTQIEQKPVETTPQQAVPEKAQVTEPQDDIEDIIKCYIDSKILSHNIIPLSCKMIKIEKKSETETKTEEKKVSKLSLLKAYKEEHDKEKEVQQKVKPKQRTKLSLLKGNQISPDTKNVDTEKNYEKFVPIVKTNSKNDEKDISLPETKNISEPEKVPNVSKEVNKKLFMLTNQKTKTDPKLEVKETEKTVSETKEINKRMLNKRKTASKQDANEEKQETEKIVNNLTKEVSENIFMPNTHINKKDQTSNVKEMKQENEKAANVTKEITKKIFMLNKRKTSPKLDANEVKQNTEKTVNNVTKEVNKNIFTLNTHRSKKNQTSDAKEMKHEAEKAANVLNDVNNKLLMHNNQKIKSDPKLDVKEVEKTSNVPKEVNNKLFILTNQKRITDPKSDEKAVKLETETKKTETPKKNENALESKAREEKKREVLIEKEEKMSKKLKYLIKKPKYNHGINRDKVIKLNFLRQKSLLQKFIVQSKKAELKAILRQKRETPAPMVSAPRSLIKFTKIQDKAEVIKPIKIDKNKVKTVKKMRKIKTLKRRKVPCLLHHLGEDRKKPAVRYIVLPDKVKTKNDGTCADWVRTAIAKGTKFEFDDAPDYLIKGQSIESFEDGRSLNEYNINDNVIPSLNAMRN